MADTEKNAAFRADVARASGAIGAAVEVVQAQAFIVRGLVDLLAQRGLLALADVRERVQAMAETAVLAPGVVAALGQLLADDGPVVPGVLQ